MSSRSFGLALVYLCAPKYHLDHSGSRGFTQMRLEVVEFIRVRVGSLGPTLVSSASSVFV